MNHCTFLGNLTRDPELRATPAGKQVVQFSIAINRRISSDREETLFLDCEAWEKRAEAIAKHFTKGKQILVEGHLRQERWEDKETHAKRSRLKLIVDSFFFTGQKSDAPTHSTDDIPAPYFADATPPILPAPQPTLAPAAWEKTEEDVPF